MTAPQQKPGRSEQGVGTPPDLIGAVENRFGALAWDLAATPENAKAPQYITPTVNSLLVDWSVWIGPQLAWLNPPFADIAPWVRKAATCGARVLVLVPASVGSNWFSGHVHRKCMVLALNPRVTFVGHTHPYPKDLLLCCYGYAPGFDVWRWR
jgi:phage N-6-adenine-methyltransferase